MASARKTTSSAESVGALWALPDGWHWDRLGNIAEIVAGQSPPSETYNAEGIGLPFFQGKAEFGDTNPLVRKWCRSPTKVAQAGDVLISVRAPVGPTNVANSVCGIGRGLAAIRADQEVVEPNWLRWWLRRTEQMLAAQGTGTTFSAITGAVLRNHPIPMPSRAEQRRIIYRLDELFSEIAGGEESLATARINSETYRQALLKAAMTGELTADWRARRGPIANHFDSTNNSSDVEAPLDWVNEIPHGWVWSSLGRLFSISVGSTPNRSDLSLWGGSVPWVSSGEVAFCRIGETRERIAQAAVKPERVHPPGTVMLGMIGEGKTRGQAAILDIAAAHNQNCASIRVSETKIPSEFVYSWLECRYQYTRADGSGGNQPALNKARVSAIAIPIPPLPEMQEIVARLSQEQQAAHEATEQIKAALSQAAALRQSILAAAFRGDLVT